MAGYAYKGKDPIKEPEPVEIKARRKAECGTPPGARRHRRDGEEVCEPCREAWNRYAAEKRGGGFTGRRNRPVAVCGTYPGHSAHVKRGEAPCDPCKRALNAYQREYRARKKVA